MHIVFNQLVKITRAFLYIHLCSVHKPFGSQTPDYTTAATTVPVTFSF